MPSHITQPQYHRIKWMNVSFRHEPIEQKMCVAHSLSFDFMTHIATRNSLSTYYLELFSCLHEQNFVLWYVGGPIWFPIYAHDDECWSRVGTHAINSAREIPCAILCRALRWAALCSHCPLHPICSQLVRSTTALPIPELHSFDSEHGGDSSPSWKTNDTISIELDRLFAGFRSVSQQNVNSEINIKKWNKLRFKRRHDVKSSLCSYCYYIQYWVPSWILLHRSVPTFLLARATVIDKTSWWY